MDPNDPNCVCTNCSPPTNSSPSNIYTNGELHLIISLSDTTVSVTLTNGNLLDDYVIERSFDIVTWTNMTGKFETDTSLAAYFSFERGLTKEFFRARVATLIEYDNAGSATGTTDCGSYIGYANYYGSEGEWGYSLETNMTRHILYSDRTNAIVSYLSRVGLYDCDISQITVPPAQIPRYRATVFFPDNLPTNSYPLHLKGLKDD